MILPIFLGYALLSYGRQSCRVVPEHTPSAWLLAACKQKTVLTSASRTPALCAQATPPTSDSPSTPPASFSQRGKEIVEIVRRNFYDAARAAAWYHAYRHYADQITDEATFTLRTRAALEALHASHTAYYLPTELPYVGFLSVFERMLQPAGVWYDSIGVDVVRLKQGYFVRAVFAGSPAAKAGVRRGDLLRFADNAPFAPITSFAGKSEQSVTLQVQRQSDTPVFPVSLIPRHIKPREEWLQAQTAGTRLFVRGKQHIGYIPLFSGAGEMYQDAVKEALAGPISHADALILDFRDGFGGLDPGFVSLFDRNVPRLILKERGSPATVVDAHWRKPLYVLINHNTHSGKEVVAFALQKHHLATLVGEKTGGAVLGGRPFLLSNAALLYLAVADGEVDGQRLEGRGVTPDIKVTDALAFAQGTDRQLDAALRLAARANVERPRQRNRKNDQSTIRKENQ